MSAEVEKTVAGPAGPPADELQRVEGIGPKISAVLREAGIITYAQLAAADPERLRAILKQAGMRLADPGTWPEQAELAAEGEWEALTEFQSRLQGGRRR